MSLFTFRGYPIVKWLHMKSCDADVVPYISVNVKGAKILNCPLRISGHPTRRRFSLPFYHESGDDSKSSCSQFKSLVLCVADNNGQTFVDIAEEPHPQAVIHNFCDVHILCAEISVLGKTNSSGSVSH